MSLTMVAKVKTPVHPYPILAHWFVFLRIYGPLAGLGDFFCRYSHCGRLREQRERFSFILYRQEVRSLLVVARPRSELRGGLITLVVVYRSPWV